MEAITTQNAQEFVEESTTRGAIYHFLATAFHEEIPLAFLETLKGNPPALDGALQTFINSLQEADLAQLRTDLAAEYARVFLNMSAHAVAPYESVYTSELHLLMQEARDEVLAMYRACGYKPATSVKIPEDHAAFELGFMAALCDEAAQCAADGNFDQAQKLTDIQAAFLQNHLLVWLPQLAQDAKTLVKTDFYQGVMELLETFLEEERTWFHLA